MREENDTVLPAGYCIKNATWQDLNRLWELEKLCFSKEDAWPYLELLAVLSFAGSIRFKLCKGKELIGFVGGEVKEGMGWITTIEVHPAYQGKGFGRALLSKAEASLRTSTIRLTTRKSNASAIRMYENMGYRPVGIWKSYYAGGEDGIVYEKKRSEI